MKDRVPLYPGRVTLTPVSGQANTYDMVRADQPTEEGTPLNKENLLADDTAAALGLSGDPTVDDAFGALDYVAQYGWYREWKEWELSYETSTERDIRNINMYGRYTIITSKVQYSDDL